MAWVGMAGFESAASSSRSQVAVLPASAAACLTWEASSTDVRWCPWLWVAIVTHLVTRPSRMPIKWSRRLVACIRWFSSEDLILLSSGSSPPLPAHFFGDSCGGS